MDELEIPTSWPLPPTSPTQAVTSLQRQLKSLRTDISELLAQAQAATDRTARALQSLRSQDVKGPASSDEPGSQETEPSLTLRDHPFARFSYQNNAQAHPLASASDAGQISNNTEQAAFLTLNLAESPIEERGRTAKVYGSGSVPAIAKIPLHTTYEQSRIFLEVTAAVKDEKTRSVQCGVVERRFAKLTAQITETTSVDVCLLIARQIVAYLRFLNLDRVRSFIYEQTRHIPQCCKAWWGKPSSLVEQALAQYSLVQEVNDPIFDGIVALVLIHFGIFHLSTNGSGARDRTNNDVSSSRKSFASLLKRTRSYRLDLKRAKARIHVNMGTRRIQALSADALTAITELCLQGVFSGAILCDVLALFSLGDIDNDLSEVDTDMELLDRFLHEGLLPRATSIRDSFADADPIRNVLDMLESMRKLKEAKEASMAQSVKRHASRLSSTVQTEEAEWIPLERLLSSTVSSWSRFPRTPLGKWLPKTRSVDQGGSVVHAQKPINMIDILNGRCSVLE